MKFSRDMLLLYGVTDRHWAGKQSLYEQVEEALIGGVTMVQLREKELDGEAFLREAVQICELCHRYHVPLIINDNVEVAIKSGADGVHVGIEDTPVAEIRKRAGSHFIIGATAKTIEQARAAMRAGADYLGVGAVFPSPTKEAAIRITMRQLRDICSSVSIPAVAIGGITLANAEQLQGGGMAGIAVVSALFGAENIREAAAKLKEAAEKITRTREFVLKTALSIAGSDSSGGAGIQADLKTMMANGVYGMSAITALTAQNTTGVRAIMEVSPSFLAQQIDAVFEDIRPDAVKIGMVSSDLLAETIAERLAAYRANHIVVDPVMIATSGSRLIDEAAILVLKEKLFSLAEVVTPNIPEAQVLSQIVIEREEDMIRAGERISQTYGCAVLIKGGHQMQDANDLLYRDGTYRWFRGRRIDNPNTHGTGCTLSSAIAANLAKGYDLETSVWQAKEYISGALAAMLSLGRGSGPLHHAFQKG